MGTRITLWTGHWPLDRKWLRESSVKSWFSPGQR